MAKEVLIQRDNQVIRVTEKAYLSVYLDKGFRLIDRAAAAKSPNQAAVNVKSDVARRPGSAASIAKTLGIEGETGQSKGGNFTDAIGGADVAALSGAANEIDSNSPGQLEDSVESKISEERQPTGGARQRNK